MLALYRKKLELYPKLLEALAQSQQAGRESLERIARLGQRFASAKDRKLAQWAEGLLQDDEKAGDNLLEGVRALSADTQQLAGLIEAVVVRHEPGKADELAKFRFGSDLRALQKTCRAEADRATAAAGGPLNALGE